VIRRLFTSLPGPRAVRIVTMVAIGLIALAALILFYEWVGNTFLDSGGTIR